MLTDNFPGRAACIAAAAVLAGLSLDASAGVIAQQRNFELNAYTAPLDGEGITMASAGATLNYQRWDPSLGTLTGAQWFLSSWLVGTAIGHVRSTSTDPNAVAEAEVDLRPVAGTAALLGTTGAGSIGQAALHHSLLDFNERTSWQPFWERIKTTRCAAARATTC